MEFYNVVNIYADKFIPIFIRVMVMLAFIPFIGSATTPVIVRTGIGLALTLLLVPIVNVNMEDPLRAVFEAFFVGAALGLMVRIVLGAIETAGQWMSISMGIGVAAVFNPQFGEVLGPLSLFYSLMGMGLFYSGYPSLLHRGDSAQFRHNDSAVPGHVRCRAETERTILPAGFQHCSPDISRA